MLFPEKKLMLRFKVVSFLIFFFTLFISNVFAIQNKFDDKAKLIFTSSNEVIVEQEQLSQTLT